MINLPSARKSYPLSRNMETFQYINESISQLEVQEKLKAVKTYRDKGSAVKGRPREAKVS